MATLTKEEKAKFTKFLKDHVTLEVSFRHEYGAGSSKKLEITLKVDDEKIDSDYTYITEGESRSVLDDY